MRQTPLNQLTKERSFLTGLDSVTPLSLDQKQPKFQLSGETTTSTLTTATSTTTSIATTTAAATTYKMTTTSTTLTTVKQK